MAPEKKRKRSQDGGESTPVKKPHVKSGDPSKSPNSAPKSNSSAPVAAVAPSTLRAVRNEEESFPRGGASALTPLEFKQISNEAARDVLFEAGGGSAGGEGDAMLKKGKKPKRRNEDKKRKNTVKEEEGKEAKGPKPEGLSFKASFCLWVRSLGDEVLILGFNCRIWHQECWSLDAFPELMLRILQSRCRTTLLVLCL